MSEEICTMTLMEWARFFRISRNTAYHLAKTNQIHGLQRIGKSYRVHTEFMVDTQQAESASRRG